MYCICFVTGFLWPGQICDSSTVRGHHSRTWSLEWWPPLAVSVGGINLGRLEYLSSPNCTHLLPERESWGHLVESSGFVLELIARHRSEKSMGMNVWLLLLANTVRDTLKTLRFMSPRMRSECFFRLVSVLSCSVVPDLKRHHWRLQYFTFCIIISAVGRNPMSACSSSTPPSVPKAYLHSQLPVLPPTPSPSPSPPAPLYSRLSNGSHRSHTHSAPSPTNSRSSFHGVSFLLQIGLTREMVNLENHDMSLSAVKDLVCSIVDQKVITHPFLVITLDLLQLMHNDRVKNGWLIQIFIEWNAIDRPEQEKANSL